MTIGWLLSEVIWKISEDEEWYSQFSASNKAITALEAWWENNSKVFSSTLDFYLTSFEKDLTPLNSSHVLQIVVA